MSAVAASPRPIDWTHFWDTGDSLPCCLASKVLSYIVYLAGPNDPVVLAGVVLTMLSLGLLAAWIPAQKALAVNPMILIREE